jgi:hypothetical protein
MAGRCPEPARPAELAVRGPPGGAFQYAPSMDATTVGGLLAATIAAEDALAELGESIEDEWSYVNDLRQAWTDRLTDVADGADGARAADRHVVEAVELAIDEASLIRDPHRAIDWLSTLPQVVLLAVGAAI